MKLVVAYCHLHPKTVEAVWDSMHPHDEVVWGDTSGSDCAYYDLLAEHWSVGEAFVVLEQDKIPDLEALRDLHDCPRSWCTYPVPMAHNGEPCDFVSLSCTKFGDELMRRWPRLMESVAERDMGYCRKHWNRLDMVMALEIGRRFGQPHWHEPGRIGHEHQPIGVSA